MSNLQPPVHVHRRACPLCESMCGLRVSVQSEQVLQIRADPDNAFSRGHICPKGTTLGDLHHDPDRLRQPMVRTGDQLSLIHISEPTRPY